MGPNEAVQALFKGWEAGNADAVAELFTADGVYEDPLQPGDMVGPDAICQGCGMGMSMITDCRIKITNWLEKDNCGFFEGFFASQTADSGDRFDFPFAIYVEMRDGKIARLAEYFDTKPLVP